MINIKKLTALFLALFLVVFLYACGSGNGTSSANSNSPATSVSDNYYQTTFHEVNHDNDLNSTMPLDDGFLCILNEVIGDNTPEGVTPSYEGQYSIYENHMYRIGFDGSMTRLASYTPLAVEPDREGADVTDYILSWGQGQDGKIVSIDQLYTVWSDADKIEPEYSDAWNAQSSFSERYFLRVLNSDGSEISCNEINISSIGGVFYPTGVTTDGNGNVIVPCDSDVLVFSADATLLQDIPVNDGYPGSLVTLPDGTVCVLLTGAGEKNGNLLVQVDAEHGCFGESYTLPDNAYNVVRGTDEYSLCYTSGSALYGFNPGDTEGTLILNWLSNDINSSNIRSFSVQADGSVCVLCSEYNSGGNTYTNELAVLKKVSAEAVPQKQILTLATASLDYQVKNQIIKFNRSSSTTHINVVEYSDTERLLTEIMAGNVPDLIDLSSVSEKSLAAKNLLVDIYPYIDADSELDRNDFFENILTALEINGCLYNVVPAFEIKTLAGAESVVGSKPGWTYEDLYAALNQMPSDCSILDVYTTRDTILETGLYMDSNLYYNMKTVECNFKNDSFTKLLEFAARFPAQYKENQLGDSNSASRIASGEQMLVTAYLSDLDYICEYDFMFGGSATFVGYPTTSGTGNLISVNNGLAMTKACADKDAAWQFLRTYYTADYEKSLAYYLPIRKDAYEAKVQKAMECSYQKDADGHYLLDENGEKIPEPKFSYYINGQEVSVDALSQAEADKVYDAVISSTRRISYDDSNIFDIVKQETAAYFAGQKSAAEVENIIQSRVSIYLREQM